MLRTSLVALCALAVPAAADPNPHVTKLTAEATKVAESVYRASGDFSGEGMAMELLNNSLACVKAAKAAFADKVPATEVVMVPSASRFSSDIVLKDLASEVVGDQRKTTVGALRDFCVKGVRAAAIGDLQTTLLTLDSWEQALADNTRKDLHLIADNILHNTKKCFPKIEMVDAAGADPNTPIKLWNRTIKA